MIKELSDKFGETTIDFKCIIKKEEVIVFMMPVIEGGKSISPFKFIGPPQSIDEQIRTAIANMDSDIVKTISDYESFLKSIEKAKKDAVKTTSKKKDVKEEEKKKQPSLF